MSVRVCPQPNGDVLVGRGISSSLDAAPTTRLRFSAGEWLEFVEGIRSGGFDSTLSETSRGSRDTGCRSSPQGCPEKRSQTEPDGKAGHA